MPGRASEVGTDDGTAKNNVTVNNYAVKAVLWRKDECWSCACRLMHEHVGVSLFLPHPIFHLLFVCNNYVVCPYNLISFLSSKMWLKNISSTIIR